MPKGVYNRKDEKSIKKTCVAEEVWWLIIHGGRTYKDVMVDRNGKYVMMGDGNGGDEKVYLPDTEYLHSMYASNQKT
jgi:hypothetical protein